ELREKGLVADAVLPKAEAWIRRFNFGKALAIAMRNPVIGMRALDAWRIENHPTLAWRVHYRLLRLNPNAYWSVMKWGSLVKDIFRSFQTAVRFVFTSRGIGGTLQSQGSRRTS